MKRKIALVVGGISSEREVSLNTGKSFAEALDELGWPYTTLDAKEDFPGRLQDLKPDVVLNALHGKWAEDGVVQGVCEYLKIPYTGSGVLASAMGMDKAICKQIWEYNGIQTAKGYSLEKTLGTEDEKVCPQISFPLVVKPARDGSSCGVSICRSEEDWEKALNLAFKYDKSVLVEEYIEGKEVAVGILGDKAFEPIEISPKEGYYDYENKYTTGKTDYLIPSTLKKSVVSELKEISLKAAHLIGCRSYSRVDFRVRNEGEIFILEINTLPGCTKTSLVPKAAQYEGISFKDFVKNIIESARLDYEGVD